MALMRSRRVILWFGVLLMAPMLFTAASSKTEDTRPGDTHPGASLAGQLLVATPEMGDPRFQHTVILVVQHDEKGALGLDSKGSDGQVKLFAGGPVQPEIGFIVHSADYHRSGTVDIDGHVAMTTDPEALRDIGRHEGPRQSLVAFGYAGWGPGQLEGELASGGWFTILEDPKLVFDIDRDRLWDEAMKRRTIPL